MGCLCVKPKVEYEMKLAENSLKLNQTRQTILEKSIKNMLDTNQGFDNETPNKSSNYKCDLCIRVLKSQFGLGCRNCNFDICKKCINKINKKNLHQHSLELVIDNFKCIICEKQYKSRKSFSCSKCKNCFICFDCAINKK
jgi:hypothetical protein